MDDELRGLYQEVILDHGRSPRNYHILDPFDCDARGYNPLCGDDIHVYARRQPGKAALEEVSFTGRGCAISQASASMMTDILRGCSEEYFHDLFACFHAMCIGGEHEMPARRQNDKQWLEDMERLQVMAGVREFPSRVKCATLAWHALHAALKGEQQAKTE